MTREQARLAPNPGLPGAQRSLPAFAAGGRPSGDGPALVVRDLTVTMHRDGQTNHPLKGLDLTIGRGEIVALVGESGSGKSTLGLAIQGLLPAESRPQTTGSIVLDDIEVVGAPERTLRQLRRTQLGSVFQDPMTSLNPTMTIGRQLREVMGGDGDPAKWLERVGIGEPVGKLRAYPHELSGGQRQRIMIAIAMCRRPVLVVADEPTTALDVTVQARVLELIRELRDQTGTAFLFVTHDLSVAASIADRIAVLYAGRLAEIGDVTQVMNAPAHPYTAALLEARFTIGVTKDRPLPTLPAAAGEPEQGCLFAPRCLLVTAECTKVTPELAPISQHAGAAACLHTEKVSAELWTRVADAWPADPPTRTDTPVVKVDNLSKVYHRRGTHDLTRALDGVELSVDEGECVALVGESGSGKSTLLRIIAGLVLPTVGSVAVTEKQPQMVYQDASASLTPWLSIGELVGERLRHKVSGQTKLDRATRQKLIGEALARVGLDPCAARLRPHQLSGGQRQRVAVARAVVVPPRLLLCDEPVSAMDVSLAASILNLLESLRRELRMAVLFVTHDLAAARFVADRIVVMQDGRIVESGPSDQIVRDPRHAYTRELLASMPEHGPVTA